MRKYVLEPQMHNFFLLYYQFKVNSMWKSKYVLETLYLRNFSVHYKPSVIILSAKYKAWSDLHWPYQPLHTVSDR